MCEELNRHGRAADAFIASYLRELLADEDVAAADPAPVQPPLAEPPPAPIVAVTPNRVGVETTV
jgi:hypothetical protein